MACGAIAFLCAGYALRMEAVFLPICGSYLIFFAAFDQRLPVQRIGFYGDFSYGVYLYAFPIQQLLVDHLSIASHPLVLTAIALPVTLVLAVGSWKFVEQPFLGLKIRSRLKALGQASVIVAPGSLVTESS
jgi:peptidoglycan/LPS O-acetylase OafA/YrhL